MKIVFFFKLIYKLECSVLKKVSLKGIFVGNGDSICFGEFCGGFAYLKKTLFGGLCYYKWWNLKFKV